jgi:hypothetical protein
LSFYSATKKAAKSRKKTVKPSTGNSEHARARFSDRYAHAREERLRIVRTIVRGKTSNAQARARSRFAVREIVRGQSGKLSAKSAVRTKSAPPTHARINAALSANR